MKMRRAVVARIKSPHEETANIVTHAIGLILSIFSLFLLYRESVPSGDIVKISSYLIFGVSISLLYFASFTYHLAKNENWKRKLKVFDHSAIYVLIAGSYTPFMTQVLKTQASHNLIVVLWILALSGIVFKLFFSRKFKLVSTFIYLAMGWLVLFVIGPLTAAMNQASFVWLVAGGLSYTTGVIFYLWQKLPYHHAIWHMFVLGGTASHVVSVLLC